MNMIKIINKRRDGSLYHYAHFLCDCLFPEVMNKVYNYSHVFRESSLSQTLGVFEKIYKEVMKTEHTELSSTAFANMNVPTFSCPLKEAYKERRYFESFRNFIFTRYSIHTLNPDAYPQVLLIKRGDRVPLIDNQQLRLANTNFTTGKERREIDKIAELETRLHDKFGNNMEAVYFEHLPFEKQVLYFYNAKMIICAHGAVMSNMFFCQPGCIIVEVTCGTSWPFFDTISKQLNLNHLKCHRNNVDDVMQLIISSCVI